MRSAGQATGVCLSLCVREREEEGEKPRLLMRLALLPDAFPSGARNDVALLLLPSLSLSLLCRQLSSIASSLHR